MEKQIAVIPGDGIGPEIVKEAVKVLDVIAKKYGHRFVSVSYTHLFTLAKTRLHKLHNFLAFNDLMAHRKHFLMMVIIYAFCMILILVPLTLKDAFQKDTFLQILKISTGDLYSQQNGGISVKDLKEKRAKVRRDLKAYDENVRVDMETMTSASLSDNGLNTSVYLMKRADGNTITFDHGKAPKLSNELALSTTLAKRYGKTVDVYKRQGYPFDLAHASAFHSPALLPCD